MWFLEASAGPTGGRCADEELQVEGNAVRRTAAEQAARRALVHKRLWVAGHSPCVSLAGGTHVSTPADP